MKNLLKTLQLLAICLLLSAKGLATTYYVKSTGSDAAAGTAWATAFQTLQKALSSTASGDQIWVAKGTYYPTTNPTDRSASFVMKAGVKIYGSFKGDEANLTNRTLAVMTANTSILSGDIDYATDPLVITGSGSTLSITGNDGNSYHVIFNNENGLTDSAVIDGFTIIGGNSFGGGNSDGGGMYNSSSSPSLCNLTFSGNFANYGGGVHNHNAAPKLSNCVFTLNKVGYGGGISNENQSSPIIENCKFFDNYAGENGGGIYNMSSSTPTLSHCTFTNNYADVDGGGISNKSSSPSLTNCTFTNNLGSQGGGMYNQRSNPTLTNVVFLENFARNDGGGMVNRDASPILINVSFVSNRVSRDDSFSESNGGGVYNYDGSPSLRNCTFINNYAKNDGGGMASERSNPSLTNCTFTGNSASVGGGMFNVSTTTSLINITFSKNSATQGGAIFNSFSVNGPATTTIKNGIFWGNTKSASLVIAGADVENETDCILTASHTAMQLLNNTTNYPSTGFPGIATSNNFFGVDPLFVNATTGNVRLAACSPAINVGNNAENSTTTDLDGNNRKVGLIDLGAYEYTSTAPPNGVIAGSVGVACVGGTIQLTASSGMNTYSWTRQANKFSSTLQNPVIPSAKLTDAGAYLVTAKGRFGRCTSGSAMVLVLVTNPSINPAFTVSPSSIAQGSTITLSAASATGSYSWSGPAGFSGSTRSKTINGFQAINNGVYRLTLTSGLCKGYTEKTLIIGTATRLASEEVKEIDIQINAFPNPVTHTITVEVSLPKPSKLNLSLFNSIGKESGTWQFNEESMTYKIELNLADLQGGQYLLQAQAGKQKTVKRLVKIQY